MRKAQEEFRVRPNEIIFVDSHGTRWNAEALKEIVEALLKQQEAQETYKYYLK